MEEENENNESTGNTVFTNSKGYEIGDTIKMNDDYFETVSEPMIETAEIEKFRGGNEMIQTTELVNSKKRKLDEVKNPKRYCKMSPDMVELMGKQCGKHSNMTMAKVLNLNVRNIQRQIKYFTLHWNVKEVFPDLSKEQGPSLL